MNPLNKKSKGLVLGFAAILATFLPSQANAASSLVQNTGVSDESLFLILTAMAIFQIVVIFVIAGVIKAIASNHDVWKMRWNKGASAILLGVLMLSGTDVLAQDSSFGSLIVLDDVGFMALIFINLVLFITFLFLTSKLNGLMKMMMKDESGKVPQTFMDKINAMLTKAVPIEQEAEVEMDHEYDGIRELDNSLPPWWLWGFYFSIAFAVVYIFNYHITGNGQLQLEEYATEMQEAEAAQAVFVATNSTSVDESNVAQLADAADLTAGAKIFKLYCGPCHGETGGSMPGGVGPNLTDEYWINGGSMNDIFKTIKYGVPEKGMVSWEAQLNAEKIQQVASYIKSLRGSNPENAKEPQGEPYIEESAAVVAPVDAEISDTKIAPGEE